MLNPVEQKDIDRQYSEETFVRQVKTADFTSDDIDAAAVALDAFTTANLAAINAAFPEPFASASDQSEKFRLYKLVLEKLESQ